MKRSNLVSVLVVLLVLTAPLLSRADGPVDPKEAEASRLLSEAQEFQRSGRLRLAKDRFHAVLQLDPKNEKARAGEDLAEVILELRRTLEAKSAQELYHPVYPAERVGIPSKPSQ